MMATGEVLKSTYFFAGPLISGCAASFCGRQPAALQQLLSHDVVPSMSLEGPRTAALFGLGEPD